VERAVGKLADATTEAADVFGVQSGFGAPHRRALRASPARTPPAAR
jgi:hypothetical protein